jgi:hypothetical protein
MDGRTQDIVGLRIVEKLVPEPRAWLFDHEDGLRTVIMDLTGALKDINIAAEIGFRSIASTQLYRPPAPMQDHFSPLAENVERFLRTDAPEDARPASILAGLYERMIA